jgi:hypothetical protein
MILRHGIYDYARNLCGVSEVDEEGLQRAFMLRI